MSLLLRAFLLPPVTERIQQRYCGYRSNGASALAAWLMTVQVILCWMFLRLESPAWQQVRENRQQWFPHISASRPRPLDGLRYLVQGIWLVVVMPGQHLVDMTTLSIKLAYWRQRYYQWLKKIPARLEKTGLERETVKRLGRLNRGVRFVLFVCLSLLAAIMALFCISQPFSLSAQFVFVVLLWGIAMVIRRIPGRVPALMLIVLSLTISCRYLWWRYTSTLNWDDPVSLTCGLLLLAAETYSWVVLVLGYFQTIWPLNRKPVAMPEDLQTWPTIDIMIPTYNEDLSVVKPTLYAALGIDWPHDKLTIYLLDDGNRPEFAAFAQELGIEYLARPTHENAKAGNINYALGKAKGEFVAIFDCDHVPTRSFLQMSLGWFFKDAKLGILQTPHHFFSPDPFERNLGRFRRTPNEGSLFYGLVQDGNDLWNATFFCGSCAVMRRSALDEIGGIAVDTVTEDAHTSLRLHRAGYSSAYIRIPQAAGLATESLSAHIQQRIRWARGMVQIFRLDNPLLGKGLKLAQRLCYANAMLHFLSGIPRLIFLTAPLAFLLLHAYIIYAPAVAILLYVLPHMIHASLTTSRVQGKYRHSFWSEIYETVLAWYIARPTTMALLNPHHGKFNVTAKGGLVKETYVDWQITRPYMVLMLLNLAGLIVGIWRLGYGNANEIMTVLISLAWVLYNMVILGGAIAVAFEARQLRQAHRVEIAMSAGVMVRDEHLYPCVLHDYSDSGVGVKLHQNEGIAVGDNVTLILRRGPQEFTFPCEVSRVYDDRLGMKLCAMTRIQHIEFIQCTFARADTWALWQDGFPEDRPINSLREILALGFRGYQQMAEFAPAPIRQVLIKFLSFTAWFLSFFPRGVAEIPAGRLHDERVAQS